MLNDTSTLPSKSCSPRQPWRQAVISPQPAKPQPHQSAPANAMLTQGARHLSITIPTPFYNPIGEKGRARKNKNGDSRTMFHSRQCRTQLHLIQLSYEPKARVTPQGGAAA